jgi:hypothetical protein
MTENNLKKRDKIMIKKIIYWLDWKNKIIKPNNQGLQEIPWVEIENYQITVFCSSRDWPYIQKEEKDKQLIIDEIKRTYQIGLATIKELKGATEENPQAIGVESLKKCFELCPKFVKDHPSHDKETFEAIKGWVFPPRFENLQQETFTNVWKIDIKSCHGQIMREYALPYNKSIHITDPQIIEQKLKEKQDGIVSFYLNNYVEIKNQQIPFVPDSQNAIKSEFKGRLILHTKLFKAFVKQYKLRGKIIYNDFWIFPHRRSDINRFLDYCDELKKNPETKRKGKDLVNVFYGAIGKRNYGGYNYRAWTLAINHLAILQTYYLYRQFQPQQVLAIRSDCIYIQGDLPKSLLKEKYHLEHYQKVSLSGDSNIFIHDLNELKSFVGGRDREELIKEFDK